MMNCGDLTQIQVVGAGACFAQRGGGPSTSHTWKGLYFCEARAWMAHELRPQNLSVMIHELGQQGETQMYFSLAFTY